MQSKCVGSHDSDDDDDGDDDNNNHNTLCWLRVRMATLWERLRAHVARSPIDKSIDRSISRSLGSAVAPYKYKHESVRDICLPSKRHTNTHTDTVVVTSQLSSNFSWPPATRENPRFGALARAICGLPAHRRSPARLHAV